MIVSDVLEEELKRAPAYVLTLFASLPESQIQHVEATVESNRLARQYIIENVVGESSFDDCRHIALAAITQADVVVSWNFQHMVSRRDQYNRVNRKLGILKSTFKTPNNLWRISMTMINTEWYPEIIPGFDALALKAKIQAEILEETRGMTEDEVIAFFRKGSKEFQTEIKHIRQKLAMQMGESCNK